jgi:hypothetical protein
MALRIAASMVWFDLLEDVETNAFGYGRSGDIADE